MVESPAVSDVVDQDDEVRALEVDWNDRSVPLLPGRVPQPNRNRTAIRRLRLNPSHRTPNRRLRIVVEHASLQLLVDRRLADARVPNQHCLDRPHVTFTRPSKVAYRTMPEQTSPLIATRKAQEEGQFDGNLL
jgi:hypothetical protein